MAFYDDSPNTDTLAKSCKQKAGTGKAAITQVKARLCSFRQENADGNKEVKQRRDKQKGCAGHAEN